MGPSPDGMDGRFVERSSWRWPIMVAFAVLVLSALFLAWYLGPTPDDLTGTSVAPTAREGTAEVTVGGRVFTVPLNHTLYGRTRAGGVQEDLQLVAFLPGFTPYTDAQAETFRRNAPDSGAVFVTIRAARLALTEAQRFENVFAPQFEGEAETGPAGLTRHRFAAESPYAGEVLFVARNGDAVEAVFRCSLTEASPNCQREMPFGDGLVVGYRFKAARITEWREIDAGVQGLLARISRR